jgi:hypothetical protein
VPLPRGLQLGDASKVAPVDIWCLGERPAARDRFGIGLVASGVLIPALKH